MVSSQGSLVSSQGPRAQTHHSPCHHELLFLLVQQEGKVISFTTSSSRRTGQGCFKQGVGSSGVIYTPCLPFHCSVDQQHNHQLQKPLRAQTLHQAPAAPSGAWTQAVGWKQVLFPANNTGFSLVLMGDSQPPWGKGGTWPGRRIFSSPCPSAWRNGTNPQSCSGFC